MEPECPWCGERLYDPFTGKDVVVGTRQFDAALEAHAEECEPYLEEMGA